ncbi:MAG: hypothetical protein ACJAV4_000733 [Pontimonas sp.]|jgi:hypothetical protein
MGFLDNFERSVERLVGGSFAKAFASGIHPAEIVASLKHEIDARAQIMSRTRILAPHQYQVALAPSDHERLSVLGSGFREEMIQVLRHYAKGQGYSFARPVELELTVSPDLSEGMLDVRSAPPGPVVWVPTLLWDSVSYALVSGSTVMGRGSDTDIHVVAKGVSRHHCEIRWNGKRAEVVDLESTNGTTLEGKNVIRAALPDACTLGIGEARILFEVVPQAEESYHALAHFDYAPEEETP